MKKLVQKVALYCRTARKSKPRIKKQRLEMERFCARQGWTIAAVYVDNGYSGLTNDRPGLTSMRRDAAKGKFSVVVVWEVSRLTRSGSSLINFRRFLIAHRVGFCIVIEDTELPHAGEAGLPSPL